MLINSICAKVIIFTIRGSCILYMATLRSQVDLVRNGSGSAGAADNVTGSFYGNTAAIMSMNPPV